MTSGLGTCCLLKAPKRDQFHMLNHKHYTFIAAIDAVILEFVRFIWVHSDNLLAHNHLKFFSVSLHQPYERSTLVHSLGFTLTSFQSWDTFGAL